MEHGQLIVGLGNPGRRYTDTRHNFGFMVLDEFKSTMAAQLSWQEKFSGLFCRFSLDSGYVELLKPQTFMNRSGQSVAQVIRFYQLPLEHLIVVHDDVDIPFGSLRVKKGGGTGGHKGLVSLVSCLGTKEFVRVRMGIGRPEFPETQDVADYVLENFSIKERSTLLEVIRKGTKAVECLVRRGATAAMNQFNKRGGV